MAGLLDPIFGAGDPIKAGNVVVSPETEARLNQINSDASRSTGEVAGALNRGVAGSLDNASSQRRESALGGDQAAVGQGIRNRYAGLLDQDISRIKSQGELSAYGVKAGQLQNAAHMMQARQAVNMQNYQRQLTAYQQNEAARAGAIKSVLGMGGMVAGAMIGAPGLGAKQTMTQDVAEEAPSQSSLGGGRYGNMASP